MSTVGTAGGTKAPAVSLERAQEALAESERNLREAEQLAHLGSWSLDLRTDRLFWSDEVYRIFEIDPHGFKASLDGFLQAIHPEDRELVRRTYSESVTSKQPYSICHRLLMRDARVKYVEERGITHYDDAGTPIRSTGTVRDITREREAELARETLERRLQQAQQLESIGRLAGGVAHDFNNMLGVILGHVELAMGALQETHPVRDNLREIEKAASRSRDLTRQLLAFARKQTIVPRVLDINRAVGASLTILRRLIGENMELLWQPGPHLWPVRMDPSQLDQILANLCVNSRDAIADAGKVTIETSNATFDEAHCASHAGFNRGDYVRLSVSDNGCGMDSETLGHIFEPFFTTKAKGQGTGLGLATVYGVVRQNNGFINIDSEVGRGTSFAIYLPRHLGEEASARAEPSTPGVRTGSECILLVEDDSALLAIFKTMLGRLGYTVLAAANVSEALRLAGEHRDRVDLLLTDVVMPEMNGRELARRVSVIIPRIRRLFMSGYTANVIAHHNVLDKGVSFIQKPFSEAELAAKIRDVLDAVDTVVPE